MNSRSLSRISRHIYQRSLVLLLTFGLVSWLSSAQASELRVASWNLGWHVSQAEVPQWIAQCSKSYQKDQSDGIWKPTESNGTIGWSIKESRAKLEGVELSVMPPCGVYQDNRFQRFGGDCQSPGD
jgi:hypothetical protein